MLNSGAKCLVMVCPGKVSSAARLVWSYRDKPTSKKPEVCRIERTTTLSDINESDAKDSNDYWTQWYAENCLKMNNKQRLIQFHVKNRYGLKETLAHFGAELYADVSKGGSVRQSGGRIGRLQDASEAGLFHKLDKERLIKIKQNLKKITEAADKAENKDKKSD